MSREERQVRDKREEVVKEKLKRATERQRERKIKRGTTSQRDKQAEQKRSVPRLTSDVCFGVGSPLDGRIVAAGGFFFSPRAPLSRSTSTRHRTAPTNGCCPSTFFRFVYIFIHGHCFSLVLSLNFRSLAPFFSFKVGLLRLSLLSIVYVCMCVFRCVF